MDHWKVIPINIEQTLAVREKILLIYSSRAQKRNILKFIKSVKCPLKIVILKTDIDLPNIQEDIQKILPNVSIETKTLKINNFYYGFENARKTIEELYKITKGNVSVFKDILKIEHLPILEAEEVFFINFILGRLINITHAIEKYIHSNTSTKVVIFRPYREYELILEYLFLKTSKKEPKELRNIAITSIMSGKYPRICMFGKYIIKILPLLYILKVALQVLIQKGKYITISRTISRREHKKSKSSSKQSPKLLFVIPNFKHLDVVTPLIYTIKTRKICLDPIIIAHDLSLAKYLHKNYYREATIDYIYSQFSTFLFLKSILLYLSLVRKWNSVQKYVYSKMKHKIDNVQLKLTMDTLEYLFKISSYRSILEYLLIKESIKKYNASAVFITNEREREGKAVAFAAKYYKIRAYNCQRGVIGDHPEVGPITTDIMFVNGEYFKRILIKRGVAPDKIKVTGNPRFDILYKKLKDREEIKRKIYNILNIPNNMKIALLIEQPISLDVSKEDKMKTVEYFLRVTTNFENLIPVIKLHPNQKDASIEQKIVHSLKLEKTVRIIRDIDIYDLLIASEIVVLRHSTVGIDAIVLGKPTITTKFIERGRDLVPYSRYGVPEARSYAELETFFKKYIKEGYRLEPSMRNKFITDFVYKFDGNSSIRVLQEILNDLNSMGDKI